MAEHKVTTNEIMDFLRENMMFRSEGAAIRSEGVALRLDFSRLLSEVLSIKQQLTTFATKDDLRVLRSDLYSIVDSYAKRHETYEIEFTALRGRSDRLEERIERIELESPARGTHRRRRK